MTPENARLDPLVGSWRTAGRTVSGPAVEISGTDTYEWMTGGAFLLHRADVRMGDEELEVIEMIGPYDPVTGTWPMRSFDSRGAFGTMHATVDDDVWTFASATERATLTVTGSTMAARWERAENGSDWTDWMDMTFTRIPPTPTTPA
ncbi:DUF1579 family protein [Actinomadura sp. 6K520]|uniref:DUF1579 family protein n=1 Tax=Actinomadura sp. 6K520 TaxID=2530364 RepID=UPI0010534262|nr:DUF1579 family protein [Actinomadura sp. 6K520]TDE36493.1 DUF1579 domain-containing protein [Actinomadura sp. 6K520]